MHVCNKVPYQKAEDIYQENAFKLHGISSLFYKLTAATSQNDTWDLV